jgi:hypothetical protein
MNGKGRYALLFLISSIQIGTGVLLYRHRVLVPDWQAGDWIVLYAAPVAAFVVQILVSMTRPRNPRSLVRASLAAVVAVVFSFLITLTINLNL